MSIELHPYGTACTHGTAPTRTTGGPGSVPLAGEGLVVLNWHDSRGLGWVSATRRSPEGISEGRASSSTGKMPLHATGIGLGEKSWHVMEG